MIRHVFIGIFIEGLSEEIKPKQLADMQAMKEQIPRIIALESEFSTG